MMMVVVHEFIVVAQEGGSHGSMPPFLLHDVLCMENVMCMEVAW
jgi:hypothetical protein